MIACDSCGQLARSGWSYCEACGALLPAAAGAELAGAGNGAARRGVRAGTALQEAPALRGRARSA